MRLFRRALSPLVALLALMLALSMPAAANAAADPSQPVLEPFASSDCPAGNACWWTGVNYTGALTYRASSTAVPLSAARSVRNRTTKAVRLYASTSGSGSSTCLAPGAQTAAVSLAVGYVRILGTTSC